VFHGSFPYLYRRLRVLFSWFAVGCLAGGASLNAQTVLDSGVPIPFSFTVSSASLLNGAKGYSIDVPANAILMVQLDTAQNTEVDLYARFGSDVAADGARFIADASSRRASSRQTVLVSNPATGQAGTCNIALVNAIAGSLVTGRLTATILPGLSDDAIAVPGSSSITLAGQPDGTRDISAAAPGNSPIQVNIPLTPGQVIQVLAVGSISPAFGPAVPPEGLGTAAQSGNVFSLPLINAPQSSLVGVFLGDTTNGPTPPNLDYRGGLIDVSVITPGLQQIFYIGNGITGGGQLRNFVVPTGATRLFLGTMDRGDAVTMNSSAWMVTIATDAALPAPPVRNPLTVPGISSITLAGQPAGTKDIAASAPFNSPVAAGIVLKAGQAIQVRAVGKISNPQAGTAGPEGLLSMASTGPVFGLSQITAPESSLVGVFVGDTLNSQAPAGLDYRNGGLFDTVGLQPALQQVFYIGNGLTSAGEVRTFTVPTGATRLFLGTIDRSDEANLNSGSWTAAVNVANSATLPQIGATGVTNAADSGGFSVAAGSILSIAGLNFGLLTPATDVPLPTVLADTQVYFNTIPAPLFLVSPTQIFAQLPVELRNEDTVLVSVAQAGNLGPAVTLSVAPFAPGIFTPDTSHFLTQFSAGTLPSSSDIVQHGDTVTLYATGLGLVLYDPPTGTPLTGISSPALLPMQVTLNQAAAIDVVSADLVPGSIGVEEVTFQVPPDAPSGAVELRVQSGAVSSNAVTITIQ